MSTLRLGVGALADRLAGLRRADRAGGGADSSARRAAAPHSAGPVVQQRWGPGDALLERRHAKLRTTLNDATNDATATIGGWFNAGTTDLILNSVAGTMSAAPVRCGRPYVWWVHAIDDASGVWSTAAFSSFTCACPAASTAHQIQSCYAYPSPPPPGRREPMPRS